MKNQKKFLVERLMNENDELSYAKLIDVMIENNC